MDDPLAAASGPSSDDPPSQDTPGRIARDIRGRFCNLPEEIKKRRETERRRKHDAQKANRALHMKTVYWKTHKRLTVPFTLPEWDRLTRFSKKQGQPPTTAFRNAGFDHIAETGSAAGDAGQQSARRSPSLHPQDPALRKNLKDLLRRSGRIENAIDRVGININQAVRHIHTNKTATLSEIRACHRLLKNLKKEVADALAFDIPPSANTEGAPR